ncbi:MAG: response regulator [Promethearchaeota archaeon]
MKISGFQVLGVANNGEEAVLMFKSFSIKPDIILMDHRMPVKNGIETTKEILKIDNSAYIIFVSADLSVKEDSLSIGAKLFIEKPFSLDKLINILKNAVLVQNIS